MFILITETHNRKKPKTEYNYFQKFLQEIDKRNLLDSEPKDVKWFKNMRKLELDHKKNISKYKTIFLVCDNENKNKEMNLQIKKKIKAWNKDIKIINTINTNDHNEYKFENFLCSHIKKNQQCEYYSTSTSKHKSNEKIFEHAAKKFHPNILQKEVIIPLT